MICPIMRDIVFLSKKSVPATKADLPVCRDLVDKHRGAIRTRLKLVLLPLIFVIVLDGRQPACVLCLDEGQNPCV